jgi:hypothetical protein
MARHGRRWRRDGSMFCSPWAAQTPLIYFESHSYGDPVPLFEVRVIP